MNILINTFAMTR